MLVALLGAALNSNSKLKHLFGRKWNSEDILKYLACNPPSDKSADQLEMQLPNLTQASV